ncbi:MAG: hypothetical protein AAGD11_10880 [Planctomycetota bacterium]
MRTFGPKFLLLVFLAAGLSADVHAVDFTEIARFSISDTTIDTEAPTPDDDIGVNAVAVAWNGSQLYLGGYNNSASFGTTSLIEVTNATSTGIVEPTYSPIFGTDVFTPGGRGYSGLALSPDGSTLAASFDDGLANTTTGIQAFDTATNTQSWTFAVRGGSGVDFDPGFPGGDPAVGSGVAYVRSFDSGRRSLLSTANGAEIQTPADGFIWLPDETGTGNVRDITFDPATGDTYVSSSNNIIKSVRTGDNATQSATNTLLVDNADAAGVNYQKLAFLDTASDGDLLIFNDRNTNSTGQPFSSVVKVADTSGAIQTANFSFIDGFVPEDGAGWYDFDFDSVSQTLAMVDPTNSQVHIFSVGGAVADADLDDDGDVDGADFLLIQQTDPSLIGQWQTEYPSGAAVSSLSAIPEPASVSISFVCVAFLYVRRNRTT